MSSNLYFELYNIVNIIAVASLNNFDFQEMFKTPPLVINSSVRHRNLETFTGRGYFPKCVTILVIFWKQGY